jgi:dCTP deaminase
MIASPSTSTAGVLSSDQIRILISTGVVSSDASIVPDQIQPASLDLRLGFVVHRVRASFLSGGRKVSERIDEFEMHRMELTASGTVLEKGCVYVLQLQETLALPPTIAAAANAKSSTGRLDLLSRVIVDGGSEFDRVPAGYRGAVFLELCPRSFSIKIRPGDRLAQLRFRAGAAEPLTDEELLRVHDATPLVDCAPLISEGLAFSVDLSSDAVVGFKAKSHAGVVDLNQIGRYDAAEFWEELRTTKGQLILDPGAFYILATRELIAIPAQLAAEMCPFLATAGEFRVHYAGFFDPGFAGRGVLEIRCQECAMVLEDKQVVGRLVFERMAEVPSTLYGATSTSNYQHQGLKLAKQFK